MHLRALCSTKYDTKVLKLLLFFQWILHAVSFIFLRLVFALLHLPVVSVHTNVYRVSEYAIAA